MPRVSLLLADDVGLGKTIEAGLVLTELTARRHVRRVLVVCPASLQMQWREELTDKFSLDFTVLDRTAITEIQREYGMDATRGRSPRGRSRPWTSSASPTCSHSSWRPVRRRSKVPGEDTRSRGTS